ncbi:MAG: hypothetical protein U1A22_01465 [Xanthomonadaceae bacterium]|nr:hypothetical protein [Xanthomonadaceae bacterium]
MGRWVEPFAKRRQHLRAGLRMPVELHRCRAERALGGIQVAAIAGQPAQAQQRPRGHGIAAGRGFVGEWLEPGDQRFVIVGGEKKAALGAILEAHQQVVGQCARPVQPLRLRMQGHAVEQRLQHKGVIVEVALESRHAALMAGMKPAVDPHLGVQEAQDGLAAFGPIRSAQPARSTKQAAGQQGVPGGQALVVQAGSGPQRAGLQQGVADALQARGNLGFGLLQLVRQAVGRGRQQRIPLPRFEVGWPVESEPGGGQGKVGVRKQ